MSLVASMFFNDSLGVENYIYWAYDWNMRNVESNDSANSVHRIKLLLYMQFWTKIYLSWPQTFITYSIQNVSNVFITLI